MKAASPDLAAVAAIMREVADGELIPRFNRLAADEVWEKDGDGTVTVADMASERRLVAALTGLVPGTVALGEEDAYVNPAAFERLREEAPVWIVDPLDGTSNFARGSNRFAMIVAYFQGGAVRAGWILEPMSGRLAMAEEGAGARDGADAALRTADAVPLERASGSLGTRLRRDDSLTARFDEVTNHRCCGIEYMALARGDIHFAHYRRLKPWDHAAGDLIVREAGGHAAGLDSETPYSPADPEYNGLLLACDRTCWNLVARVLRPAVAALG
jgi:fructose-1,6-bisphosphatase/inositol monophosphatase family enzyme